MTDRTEQFEAERRRLRAIAYRMLGTPDDADDIVQEAWIRFDTAGDGIHNPAAWLTTVVTRLSIDRLRSAQKRREHYVGPWLPEPVGGQVDLVDPEGDLASADPAQAAVLAESLTLGFLAVMERLSPVERAVYLLHDVFGYRFAEVAAMVERSEPATRQLAKRARDRIQAERPRFSPQQSDVEALTDAFMAAAIEGDVKALESMLLHDVVVVSDGGAENRAARVPVVGRDRVARFVSNLARRHRGTLEVHKLTANGQLGYYFTSNGEPFMLVVANWIDGKLAYSGIVRNPAKLTHIHESVTS